MPNYKKMNPEHKKRWLKALRSGDYAQTKNYLCRRGESFCCLGVALDVFGEGWDEERKYILQGQGTQTKEIPVYSYQNNHEMPPLKVMKEWGLSKAAAQHLAEMNDDGLKFPVIADWIEKKL